MSKPTRNAMNKPVPDLKYPGGDAIKKMRRSKEESTVAGRLQWFFADAGFYDGPRDRRWSLGLKRAVKAWQRKKGLTADGIPGPATWKAMGWPIPAGSGHPDYPFVWFRPNVHIPPNADFMRRLNIVGKEGYEKHGKRLVMVSGYRPCGSPSDATGASTQWGLYKLWKSGRGNLAATPCSSNHGRGNAADIGWEQKNGGGYVSFLLVGGWARELAKSHGLCFPVGGESWHSEIGNTWRV